MRFSTTFSFMELSRSEAVAKGKELAGLGRSWHIHALHPGCRFNPKPDQYCFVVEDSDSSLMWCVFSENPFTAECQELVTLLHGDEILDASRSEDTARNEAIVQSARKAFLNGDSWHHHMMKPGCVLSPSPNHHVITLEREGCSELETLISDEPPDDALREIELMYFAQFK